MLIVFQIHESHSGTVDRKKLRIYIVRILFFFLETALFI